MKKLTTLVCALLTAVVLSSACVERKKELTAVEKQALSKYVSKNAPKVGTKLGAAFDKKVELVGYDVSGSEFRPGSPLTVTWYWKVLADVGSGWRLFTHIADASGKDRINQDNEGVVRRLYPPSQWKVGETIRDEQTIVIPEDWNSGNATLYVGLWKGADRMKVTAGPNDGKDRVLGLRLPVAKPVPEPVSSLAVTRTPKAIKIDGKLDEPAWENAWVVSQLNDPRTGNPAEPVVSLRALYDDQHLYVAVDVRDKSLKSTFANHDDHLWEQDAVEFMVDPDGDGKNYFEIQVAPTGKVFDTRYDSRREPKPFGHVDWSSNIKASVTARGTVNDDDDDDDGYLVEAAIPWKAFGEGVVAPRHQETWRFNVYVMDQTPEGQRAVAWSSPKVPDFHVPDRFGKLEFLAFDPRKADGGIPVSERAGNPGAGVAERRAPVMPPDIVKSGREPAAGGAH